MTRIVLGTVIRAHGVLVAPLEELFIVQHELEERLMVVASKRPLGIVVVGLDGSTRGLDLQGAPLDLRKLGRRSPQLTKALEQIAAGRTG